MNKKQLIEKLATKAKTCSKAEAGRCLDAFIDIVRGALKNGDRVRMTGFGTFLVKTRKARKGINPKTGDKIEIPATKVVRFATGATLKRAVKK